MEIERKFLVDGRPWLEAGAGLCMRQGYLARGKKNVVRVRVAGEAAWLTVKGPTQGLSRAEFEYAIPAADAEELLALCDGEIVEKTRYVVTHAGARWEIDVFEGRNAGLVVAEIELDSESQPFSRPAWLGREVSHDLRYANSNLSVEPYAVWREGG